MVLAKLYTDRIREEADRPKAVPKGIRKAARRAQS